MSRGRIATAIAVALLAAQPANGQQGEVQAGGLATYGLPASFGSGAGLVLGIAAGRIIYVGARAVFQTGATETAGPSGALTAVRMRASVFALDVGILFPMGSLELVPGAGLGWVRYAQREDSAGTLVGREHATKFLGAPSLALHVPVAGLRVIPEIQYYITDDPGLPRPTSHRGFVATIRLVIPIEVGRIRY